MNSPKYWNLLSEKQCIANGKPASPPKFYDARFIQVDRGSQLVIAM